MNKYVKYILTIGWILFSRSYDAYCSVLLTPDLKKEANPLVTVGGISSWTTIIVILSIVFIYVMYAFTIRTFRPMDLFPKEENLSFSNFVSFVYLGKKTHWTSILVKYPKDLRRLNQVLGELSSKFLVFAGLISTLMWILIHYSATYRSIHQASIIYVLLIVGCLCIAYFWFLQQFKIYRQMNS
ncbi:MAG: hypothetical protein RJB36_1722 [Bacteroidota bacterium]|jgi:Kef-type K+ transport system membrane component KefB